MASKCVVVVIVALAVLSGCGGGGPKVSQPSTPVVPTSQPAQPQGMQVTLESPQVGTSAVPVPVNAKASSPNGISGWIIYVDDQPTFQGNPDSTSLSVSVPLGGGNHIMYVRAWDQGGIAFATSPTLQVNVNGSEATIAEASSPSATNTTPGAPGPQIQPPAATALPSVPSNAKVWTAIQNMGGWQSCSDCAGGSPTSNFWSSGFQVSPSMSGSSREFYLGGHAWSNALWFEKVAPGQTGASHFLWDFWVRFDGTSAAHAHSAEYDMWQAIGGQEFMMGSQCNFDNGVWDVWDSKNFQWKPTDASCRRFSPDTWHHVQWYVERWGSHQYHYGVLVVDGNVQRFDRTYETNSAGWDDSVGVQFQLDQNGSGTPLHEWVDNVKLSIW